MLGVLAAAADASAEAVEQKVSPAMASSIDLPQHAALNPINQLKNRNLRRYVRRHFLCNHREDSYVNGSINSPADYAECLEHLLQCHVNRPDSTIDASEYPYLSNAWRRLTRGEWTEVKRCVRWELGRPRRFSINFLQSERSQLNALNSVHPPCNNECIYFWDYNQSKLLCGIVQYQVSEGLYDIACIDPENQQSIIRRVWEHDFISLSSLNRNESKLNDFYMSRVSTTSFEIDRKAKDLWNLCLTKARDTLAKRWPHGQTIDTASHIRTPVHRKGLIDLTPSTNTTQQTDSLCSQSSGSSANETLSFTKLGPTTRYALELCLSLLYLSRESCNIDLKHIEAFFDEILSKFADSRRDEGARRSFEYTSCIVQKIARLLANYQL